MFRKIPPLELLEQVLRCCKINGLDDKRWFSKDDISLEAIDQWLPLLEPYYLPCKADRYLHEEINGGKVITILRHMFKAHAIEFKTQERVVNGKKTTLYQVLFYNSLVKFD